jgi:hypothetical protein
MMFIINIDLVLLSLPCNLILSFALNTVVTRSFLFCPGELILDKIETICFQQEKFGNETNTFWFRFQNDIGKFLTLPVVTTNMFQESVDALSQQHKFFIQQNLLKTRIQFG